MFSHRPSFKVRRQSTAHAMAAHTPGATFRDPVRAAAWYTCERLEQRRLLTTTAAQMTAFYGTGTNTGQEVAGIGTGGGVANGTLQESTYTYLDANENEVRIAMWGTITAEFLFVNVSGADNTTSLVDPVPYTADNLKNEVGADLFAVYISSASPTASISIAQVNTNPTSGNPDEAFNGSNTITVPDEQGGAPITVTSGAGAVWLGARLYAKPQAGLKGAPGSTASAVLSVPLTATIGVRPVTADGTLYPGVVSAPGVSLNRFLLGGTVTGRVDLGGSINTFYAGSIWTGDANGITEGQQPGTQETVNNLGQLTTDTALNRNFSVAGDLDNLITLGDLGTNGVLADGKPTYETGFRLDVGGHIGQVKSEGALDGSFYDENLPTFKGLGLPQTEVYTYDGAPALGESYFEGNMPNFDDLNFQTSFINGNFVEAEGGPSLADSTTFSDGSFAGAQFLGTPFSSQLGHNAIQVTGEVDDLFGHALAVYGVALGADQTIVATLNTDITYDGDLQLGIFGPEAGYATGTLLASTYDARNTLRLGNQPITFTSTDAGVYYFAVAYTDDVNFTGTGGTIAGAIDYQLGVTGVKNLGIGAIAAAGSIELSGNASTTTATTGITTTQQVEPSVRVDYGDLGAIISTTAGATLIAGDSASTALPVTATTGNIRVIQSGSIGFENGLAQSLSPDINAAGNVGTIRSSTAGGFLGLNPLFNDADVQTGLKVAGAKPITGNYQLIDCAGLFDGNLVADGNIGTIRAQNIGDDLAPTWTVDANDKSDAGTIDLVDMTGTHFGTLDAGGPKIKTGPGGNVRYIHIPAAAAIYNDNFFGGDQDLPLVYSAGEAVSLIDDSGTRFTITPYKGLTVNSGTAGAGTTTTTAGDTLAVQTYGIEDKGGVAVISVTCTAGASTTTTTGTGTGTGTGAATGPTAISVDTSETGVRGSVEFGSIDMVGAGTTLTYGLPATATASSITSTSTSAPVFTTAGEADSVSFNGKNTIDAYDITATTAVGGGLAGMTSVINNTPGEIVNLQAASVETLEAHTLGIARTDSGAPVSGATVFSNAFPFQNQRTLIQVGNAQTIESSGQLGNILSTGTIGNILPDSGAGAPRGDQTGFDGPVYASGNTGNLLNVNVGWGLGYSGSGNYATTGLFADNYIGTVTNQNGSNIRGDIVATGIAGGLPIVTTTTTSTGGTSTTTSTEVAGTGPYIGAIDLTDGGSIIDANIYTTTTLVQAIQSAGPGGGFVVRDPNSTTQSNGDLANAKYAIGSISLKGNGGIIGSTILAGGVNTINVSGGFGIITSEIFTTSPDIINNITASGYGIRSSTISGQNSINTIDATGTGKELKVTSYSAAVRQSETGATTDAYSGQPLDVYDDLDAFLGTTAKKPIRKGATEAGVIADTTITGTYQLGSLTAWRLVGHTVTPATTTEQEILQEIDDTPPMEINIANNIGTLDIRNNTNHATITTGTLKDFESNGNVVGSTFNIAGEINSFTAGFINGSSHINDNGPDGIIDYLATTQGLNGTISAGASIGEILVGTDLGSADINSDGGINELYVKHSMLAGSSVVATRTLGTLVIRHGFLGGASIQAQSITKKTITGANNGTITLVKPL